MTYDDIVYVVKCEVVSGMDRIELRYVTKFGTLCGSPVNAMWLESYDAAKSFKKNVIPSNFEDNNSIMPGSLAITAFRLQMQDIGLQYTLKKKPDILPTTFNPRCGLYSVMKDIYGDAFNDAFKPEAKDVENHDETV